MRTPFSLKQRWELGPRRRFADRTTESAEALRNLGIGHGRGGLLVHVWCERGVEFRPVEKEITVLRRPKSREDSRGQGITVGKS